jgi:hypothetical protein
VEYHFTYKILGICKSFSNKQCAITGMQNIISHTRFWVSAKASVTSNVLHVQMGWCLCRAFRQDFASSWSSEWVSECPVDNLTKIQPLHITNQSIAISSTKPATSNAFLPLLNFFPSCQSAPLSPVSSMKHFGHKSQFRKRMQITLGLHIM